MSVVSCNKKKLLHDHNLYGYYLTLKGTMSENKKVPNNLKSGFCLMQDSEDSK